MTTTYAAFTESEHRERLARVRAILKHNGIACCVSVAPEHLYYLAGHDSWVSVNSPQALVFMAEDRERARRRSCLAARDVVGARRSLLSSLQRRCRLSDDAGALVADLAAGRAPRFDGARYDPQRFGAKAGDVDWLKSQVSAIVSSGYRSLGR